MSIQRDPRTPSSDAIRASVRHVLRPLAAVPIPQALDALRVGIPVGRLTRAVRGRRRTLRRGRGLLLRSGRRGRGAGGDRLLLVARLLLPVSAGLLPVAAGLLGPARAWTD